MSKDLEFFCLKLVGDYHEIITFDCGHIPNLEFPTLTVSNSPGETLGIVTDQRYPYLTLVEEKGQNLG